MYNWQIDEGHYMPHGHSRGAASKVNMKFNAFWHGPRPTGSGTTRGEAARRLRSTARDAGAREDDGVNRDTSVRRQGVDEVPVSELSMRA